MEHFEQNVNAIRTMIAYDLPLNEIHDKMISRGMSEDEFFLVYQAAIVSNHCDHEWNRGGHFCTVCGKTPEEVFA
jgi:hypothetical protein